MAKLRKEQEDNELLLEQLSARIPLPQPKKYQVVKEILKEIVRNYDTWTAWCTYALLRMICETT